MCVIIVGIIISVSISQRNIDNLQTQVSGLNNQLSNLLSDYNNLQNGFDNLQNKYNVLSFDFETLNQTATTLENSWSNWTDNYPTCFSALSQLVQLTKILDNNFTTLQYESDRLINNLINNLINFYALSSEVTTLSQDVQLQIEGLNKHGLH